MKIKFMLDKGAFAPTKAHTADAGFDLRTPKDFILFAIDAVTVDTGVHVQIPEGYVGMIKSKSGLNVKEGIVTEGVIDSGYTGSIKVKMYRNCIYKDPKQFNVGDKITQLVILPIPEVEMEETDHFEETERGDNGFGSSGR